MNTHKILNLGAIVLDPRLQSRVEINEEAVEDYSHTITDGGDMPAIEVTFDGINYYLTDGFHRYHAHKRAGKASIQCVVVPGTFRDAQLRSTAVNSKHGMRRTYGDKRKAVMVLLEDFEWSQWSNSEIAKQCGVSHTFVKNLRDSGSEKPETVKYKTSTGEVAERKATTERKEKPKAEPKPEVKPEPEPQVDSEATQKLAASHELIDMLQTENQQLKDRLALGFMDGTEDDKNLAKQTIDELREELRITKIELEAVKVSRGTFQNECHQMRKQITMLQSKLKKAGIQ